MENRSKTFLNANLAPTLVKDSPKLILRLLIFIGKPLYLFILYTFLAISLALYVTGYFVRASIKSNFSFFPRLFITFSQLIQKFSNQISAHFHQLKNIRVVPVTKTFPIKLNTVKIRIKILSNLKKYFSRIITLSRLAYSKFPSYQKTLTQYLLTVREKTFRIKQFFNIGRLHTKLYILFLTRPLIGIKGKITSRWVLKFLAFASASVLTVFVLTGILVYIFILRDLPPAQELTKRKVEASTKIYDRNGILLYKIFDEKNRTPVTLSQIPTQVRSATIAIEDENFYSHPGFSIKGIARATIKNLQRGELTGGSTITQQLVKNALLSSEKTLIRKLREIALAVKVEMTYSKDQILEMYLNEVSYGGTAYGIQEAARMYFGKDVDKLSLAEAALLAGLPKSPTQHSPYGANPEAAIGRKNEVLNRMYVNGYITQKQYEEAQSQDLKFAENKIDIKAPHFVMYVRQQLEQTYGKEVVENGGLEVVTTLDYKIQELAQQVVKDEIEKLAKLKVGNGAVVVISPASGEILAMVGSKDYFDTENDGNVNVTISPRQPGSSIKVVNYAYALSHGYSAATIIPDTPVTFLIPQQPPYTPKNYEGGFRGNLTLRSAFAESRNVPAVKVLNSYGVKNMIDMGQTLGITTWNNPSDYGLSLTLGGGEVKLLDLAYVYATIANYGVIPKQQYILKITNYKGKVLEENYCNSEKSPSLVAVSFASESAQTKQDEAVVCKGTPVLDPRVAFIITDILRDNDARAPSFGSNSLLVIPKHKEVAVKTGTSNNLRDNLTIGYNQKYVVATWVGNNDNSEMSRIASGVTGASSIFNKIMSGLLAEEKNHDWVVPGGLAKIPICTLAGTLACEGCRTKVEWFLDENKPQRACSPDWFEKDEEGNQIKINEDKRRQLEYQFFGNEKPKKKRFLFNP